MCFRMDRNELRTLSRVRLAEAQALLRAGMPDGAYYLAGYAVECALKACIAKATRRHEFPDQKRVNTSFTHSLKELIRVAELRDALGEAANADPRFREYWDIVESWSEQSRYGRSSAERARALLEAVSNRNHGVIQWVRRYW